MEPGPDRPADAPPVGATASAAIGLVAAWIAAGSTGALAETFRHALVWTLVATAVVLARPSRRQLTWLAAVALGIVALALLSPAQPATAVLGVAVMLAILAWDRGGLSGRVLLLGAVAVAALGVYRLACVTIPTAWMVSGVIGLGLGRLVQAITGRPLWIGRGFGGLDFLVVMGIVYALWLRWTQRPRVGRAVYAAAAILAGYLGYLVVLAFSTDLLAALPELPASPSLDPGDYRPPEWSWSAAMRTLIPWNLPLLAALAEAAIAALMFRWAAWKPVEEADMPAAALDKRSRAWRYGLPVGLAVATAVFLMLSPFRSDMTGKTVVTYQRGQVNWSKPQHGQLEPDWAGTYGTLPDFVASLGGNLVISPDLSDDDLAAADVLLLAHPTEPWTLAQLERIEAFVRRGGSLLVVAGPTIRETADRAAVNDVLRPTGMAIRDDVAVPVTPRWLDAAWGMAHPATLGLDNRRGGFGLRVTSSIATRWPARPILVGQWGFGDPGNDAATAGVFRFEPGEKLGDLVLAAERPLGLGTVVVLADDTCLSSLTNATSWPLTGRLLSYLASRPSSPQDWWRQALGLLGCLGLVGLVLWRPGPNVLIVLAAALAVSVAAATGASRHVARVVPGDRAGAARVAYIDASHLESYNDEPWSNDGIDALVMTLARNGFVPLKLPELTAERLDRASLLISIAPARPFSAKERQVVREFVEQGGVFLLSAGATESTASQPLLGEFDFAVPPSPVRPGGSTVEPEPVGRYPEDFGRFPTIYFRAADHGVGDYEARAWFFSAWPVDCRVPGTEVLARGYDNVPIVVRRPVGRGSVVVIGDSGFALNHNLGYYDGQMVEGLYDNADFCRWLLTRLFEGTDWVPPDPALRPAGSTDAATSTPEPAAREASP